MEPVLSGDKKGFDCGADARENKTPQIRIGRLDEIRLEVLERSHREAGHEKIMKIGTAVIVGDVDEHGSGAYDRDDEGEAHSPEESALRPANGFRQLEAIGAGNHREDPHLRLPRVSKSEGDDALGADDGAAEAGDDDESGNHGGARRGNAGGGYDASNHDVEDEAAGEEGWHDKPRYPRAPEPPADKQEAEEKTEHGSSIGEKLLRVVDAAVRSPCLAQDVAKVTASDP